MPPVIDEHDDDKPVGRILSRREIIKLIGGGGAAMVASAGVLKLGLGQVAFAQEATEQALPACIVRPELTEGPYFVGGQLMRSDIRIDPTDGSVKEGLPLHLVFRVSDVSSDACTPIEGAHVDVWHCDADGVYSGVSDAGTDTTNQYWLRGYQLTDELGTAKFVTIYPGWYSGRAVHIHFKIRTDPESDSGYEFTSQLFFPEDITELVYAQEPYAAKGLPNVPNENDNIYRSGGDELVLDLTELSADDMATAEATARATAEPTVIPTLQIGTQGGYEAVFDIGLDLSDASVSASDSAGGGMGGGPGGRPGGGNPPPSNPGG